jgi:hypothetical protein
MDVIPFAVRMRLIVARVISFFIYYDFIYFALDFYSLRKLTVAFNACVTDNVSGMSCYIVKLLTSLGCLAFLEKVNHRPSEKEMD